MNPGPPEYEAVVLTTRPHCSVSAIYVLYAQNYYTYATVFNLLHPALSCMLYFAAQRCRQQHSVFYYMPCDSLHQCIMLFF
jgi:hypothetical protein